MIAALGHSVPSHDAANDTSPLTSMAYTLKGWSARGPRGDNLHMHHFQNEQPDNSRPYKRQKLHEHRAHVTRECIDISCGYDQWILVSDVTIAVQGILEKHIAVFNEVPNVVESCGMAIYDR